MDPKIRIEIMTDHHVTTPINDDLLRAAVVAAASDQGFREGEIGIRVTDDAAIRQINMDHLNHDYPTDVISFDYGSESPVIEGEMVVSIETAACRAKELGWPMDHELTLYVVHGTLHIAGLDDLNEPDQLRMRAAEQRIMISLGIDAIDRFGPAATEPVLADRATDPNLRQLEGQRREEQA